MTRMHVPGDESDHDTETRRHHNVDEAAHSSDTPSATVPMKIAARFIAREGVLPNQGLAWIPAATG